MSQFPPDTDLNNCGCCADDVPALGHTNPPAQSTLNYRLATQPVFLQRMLSRLSTTMIPDGDNAGKRPLSALTTRDSDDPAVALLDAWAVLADVLCFYQERIANEGFLRTATERQSVLQLARAIGYELNPGVAASTYLAFTIDDLPGSPGKAVLPARTQVMSVPGAGELPQTFETGRDFIAHAGWNSLKPRLKQAQPLDTAAEQVYIAGITDVRPGQQILIVDGGSYSVRRVHKVEVDAANDQTRLLLAVRPAAFPAFTPPTLPAGQVELTTVPLNEITVQTYILGREWADADLRAFLATHEWDEAALLDYLSALAGSTTLNPGDGVFVLGESLSFFGHNAPHYDSMPTDINGNIIYPGPDWDDTGWQIWHEPLKENPKVYFSDADAYLERKVDNMLPETWIMLRNSAGSTHLYWVTDVSEKSIVGFSLSATVSGVELADSNMNPLTNGNKPAGLLVRNTIAFRQTRELALVDLPIQDVLGTLNEDGELVGAQEIMLDGLVLGLDEGQALAVQAERTDAPGVVVQEVAIIAAVRHLGGYTIITFSDHLQHPYRRDTLQINANCVPATHGQTVHELLGNGDGAKRNQTFRLGKPPLTHVPSTAPSGGDSTLEVRVDGVLWAEAASLYGLDAAAESYTVRLEDDGYAYVIFGDGRMGARVPTGVQNVTARYRSGTGLAGEVDAGTLTLLQTRPLGLRGVTNPLPASGGQDPETVDDARHSAPLAILTLDRIVSLRDYEDFARAFGGVGKAKVVVLWDGNDQLVHITIASAGGETVAEEAPLRDNLAEAIAAAGDPRIAVRIDTYLPRFFNVTARLLLDERYITETVLADAGAALTAKFAFAARQFGQPVTAAEVIQVLQGVTGVIAVDLDQLYLVSDPAGPDQTTPQQVLPAAVAHWDGSGGIALSELLLVNPAGMDLQELPT